MTEEEKKIQEDAFDGHIKAQQEASAKLKDYASSPIKIDTSGQKNHYAEFVNSEYAKRLAETDEQRAARVKRERTARRLAALTDGIAALSNVAGAMAGATPVKLTSASAAHKKAVDEARRYRENNARLFELAADKARSLDYKQAEANAKRYERERKARLDAGKRADSIDKGIIAAIQRRDNAQRAQDNADRNYELSRNRADNALRHQKVMEGQGQQRIEISRSKGGGGKGKDYDMHAVNRHWEGLSQAEKDKYLPPTSGGKGKVTDEIKKRAWDNRGNKAGNGKNLTRAARNGNKQQKKSAI